MTPATTIIIAVAVLVVAAGIVLVTSARRSDVRGAGALSRETVKRDKPAAVLEADEELVGVSGRQVEASAALDRRPAAPATQNTEVAPFVPPDADAIGISRRKFFNRSIIVMMGLGLSGRSPRMGRAGGGHTHPFRAARARPRRGGEGQPGKRGADILAGAAGRHASAVSDGASNRGGVGGSGYFGRDAMGGQSSHGGRACCGAPRHPQCRAGRNRREDFAG